MPKIYYYSNNTIIQSYEKGMDLEELLEINRELY